MRVAVSTLTRGDPRVEFVGSLFALSRDPRITHIDLRPTLYLHHGREEAAIDFLANDRGDWLLFIDDDTEFTVDATDAVFAAADPDTAPIVGGVYWSPNRGTSDPTHDVFPVVFQHGPGQRGTQYADTFVHQPFPRAWVADQTAPFPCDAIGTGFLLIHKSVLVAMQSTFPGPLHWFDMGTIDGVGVGEDIWFCHRAKSLGYPIFAVPLPSSAIAHVKSVHIRRPNLDG